MNKYLRRLYLNLLKLGSNSQADKVLNLLKKADSPLFSVENMLEETAYYGKSEYYPDLEEGEDYRSGDIYYGRNVLWIGTKGKMFRADPSYMEPISGNIFYPDKINDIVNEIRYSDEKKVLFAPYGNVSLVTIDSIKESIEYDGANALTTGDQELDEYISLGEDFFVLYDLDDEDDYKEYLSEKKRLEEELEEAIATESGDIGQYIVQVRDGNHRAFGAIEAGEPYVWIAIMDDKLQSLDPVKDAELLSQIV